MIKPKYVIISDDSIIYNAICDNCQLGNNFVQVKAEWQNFLANTNKVDLLIIDKALDSSLIPFYKIKTIINLGKQAISINEIKMTKPLRLLDIIEIIDHHEQDAKLFCSINDNLIYHEKLATINSRDNRIKLTGKENRVFSFLLKSQNFTCQKDKLLQDIWNYHQDSESTTVDTHLHKLRQKLPKGLLMIKNNLCQLNVESLE